MNKLLLFISALLLSACGTMQSSPYTYLKSQNIARPTQNNFPHCYNYGCDRVVNVEFSQNDWAQITILFNPVAQSAEEEREKISKSIGLFEQIVGEKTGTKADIYGTFRHIGRFQHDCIDESTNTTIYLSLLYERGLLVFHSLSAPDSRLPIIHAGHWPHRTAILHDKQSLQAFAVDSWFHDNGFPAEIVPLTLWKKGWKAEENFRNHSDSLQWK